MRKNFSFKIILFFSLIITSISLISLFLSINTFKREYTFSIRKEMEKIASSISIFSDKIFYEKKEIIDSLAKAIGRESGVRITFISKEGIVLGDSNEDPKNMDNHSTRIEVISALHKKIGYSYRFSKTTKQMMFYVALPVIKDDSVIGIIRISRFAKDVNEAITLLILIFFITYISIIIFFIFVSRSIIVRLTKPLKMLTDATEKISKGKFDINLIINTGDEIEILFRRFQEMSEKIKYLISKISEEKEELKAILSSLQELVIEIDNNGKITNFNESFKKIFNKVERGKYYWEVIRDNYIINFIEKVLNDKIFNNREFLLNGRIYECKSMKTEEKSRLILTFYDITERKNIEMLKKQLIDNIVHELKTPLTIIKGYLESLKGLKGENRRYIQIALKNNERLINLANDLAMLSKIENQKVKFSAKKINLKRVVSDTVEFFKIKAKEKGIKIFIKGRNRIFVYGDPDLIEQMLVNLIDNAIKYTEKGKIEIVLSREDNYAIIQVSDTGIGIPEADIPHIFERFYVVDKSRSKRICGTGLGLSIVKHIVLLHKGSISVESKENKGTTFTIKIPINQNS